MKKFFSSNEIQYRLGRTILQSICGIVIANLDMIIARVSYIPGVWRPLIVAFVMAILSPIMAELGKEDHKDE